MVDFEMHKIVVVSTAHIRKEDNDLLGSSDCQISNYPFEYGYFVYLTEDETANSLVNRGFSPEFAEVYLAATKYGAQYMQLDCDGQTYDEFKSFEW